MVSFPLDVPIDSTTLIRIWMPVLLQVGLAATGILVALVTILRWWLGKPRLPRTLSEIAAVRSNSDGGGD